MSAAPHICFVAPALYPVLAGSTQIESVGGAEVQQAILARTLQQAGYRVSVITMDYGQPAEMEIDGIRVLRAHAPQAGLPVLRFIYPRMTSMWQAMALADADIYYQRASGMLTGLVAQFCVSRHRRFIYAAASDADFYPELPLITYGRDKWFYRRGLRMADQIVVQNETQRLACMHQFGRSAALVPSCHATNGQLSADPAGYVLWVGTIKNLKRPELFLELARRLPDLRFRLVGGGDANLLAQLRAAGLNNLEVTGFVPYAQVAQQFAGARVFVNTSEFEGFPNTFLQAWSRAIPTVSFFDNGSRLDGLPVTRCVADIEEMATVVAEWMRNEIAWESAGQRVQTYFNSHHTPEAALAAYTPLLTALAA